MRQDKCDNKPVNSLDEEVFATHYALRYVHSCWYFIRCPIAKEWNEPLIEKASWTHSSLWAMMITLKHCHVYHRNLSYPHLSRKMGGPTQPTCMFTHLVCSLTIPWWLICAANGLDTVFTLSHYWRMSCKKACWTIFSTNCPLLVLSPAHFWPTFCWLLRWSMFLIQKFGTAKRPAVWPI